MCRTGCRAQAPAMHRHLTSSPAPEPIAVVVRTMADRLAYAALLEQQRRWLEGALGAPIHVLQPGAAAEYADPFAAYDEDGTTAFLARRGGRPVGTAALTPVGGEPGTVELTRVFVAARARGSGVGAALVAAVVEEARGAGAERIALETHEPTMGAAVRMYRRAGFRDRDPLGPVTHPGVLALELDLVGAAEPLPA